MPTSSALRVINQARVLTALRRPGPHSRASLSEDLRLTRSTITVIISALMEAGLVHEVDTEARDPKATGRPRVEITLRGPGAYFGGLDVGNEKMTAVIADLNGDQIEAASLPLAAGTSAQEAEQTLIAMMQDLLARRPEVRLEGIGLTVPGMVSPQGVLQWAPRLGWRDVTIGNALRSALQTPVSVENDANAAAIGEAFTSRAEGMPNILYVLLESGVGGGLLVDGQLYRGSLGRVGEAGHVRLPTHANGSAKGSAPALVEDLLDAAAFLRTAERHLGSHLTWEGLDALGDGLPPALLAQREQWQRTLGWLTSTMVWLLDPAAIVFGGSAATLLAHDRSAFDEALRANGVDLADTTYAVSALGEAATTVGAVSLPMREFFAIPHDIFTTSPAPPAASALPGPFEAVS